MAICRRLISPEEQSAVPDCRNDHPRRSHGNLISSNMSFAGTNTLENKLYEIAFDNNQITTLKKNDFSNYTKLRVLSLRKNQITTIEIGALPSPGNLEVLDIGNNLLDSNSICYLKNLTEVWEMCPSLLSILLTETCFQLIIINSVQMIQVAMEIESVFTDETYPMCDFEDVEVDMVSKHASIEPPCPSA
ncbi:unnamed protein product [Mytilus edulis]|uniref:Uncharacterized protein n=1 Tax=Mytilus edulis TaxID=6550 RepID=A0A8S3T5S9_MYTED|nr:unnamed protein product [Mytilus edulis]